jgi:hypothetical protein
MATASIPDRTAVTIGAGFAAGVLGGILIDAFLVVANHTGIISVWQFVASALVGPAAFSSQSYAALGFAMHFAISIVWASIYAGLDRCLCSRVGRSSEDSSTASSLWWP